MEQSIDDSCKVSELLKCNCSGTSIHAQNVSIQYSSDRGKGFYLRPTNFIAQSCEVTTLAGPSGCGKSSFLQLMNRIVDFQKGVKISGTLNIGDLNVLDSNINLQNLRKKVGMVFQKPSPFPLSIGKNLFLPMDELKIKSKTEKYDRLESALKHVGLWNEISNRLNDSAFSLSGGQQQRLCIARALIMQPEVLLLDEPTSALDPVSTQEIEDLILRLKGELTIILVTHNMQQARKISDSIALFWSNGREGWLEEQSSPQELFEETTSPLCQSFLSSYQV